MAIVFQNKNNKIIIDSKTVIGVMGRNYDKFLLSLTGEDVFYLDKIVSVSNKKVSSLINNNKIIDEFNLRENFLDKRVYQLSHSEEKILKYILLILSDKKIIVIDEPFIDLDYDNKKKVKLLINRLIKENKTVIVGSVDSNIIYYLCKKVLLINNSDYYYGDVINFKNKKLLKKYHIAMPDIVKFIELAKEKNIKLRYSNDIRDLIKDVYRNVSQK